MALAALRKGASSISILVLLAASLHSATRAEDEAPILESGAGDASGLLYAPILEEAEGHSEWLTSVRRELHSHPELMFDLEQTAGIIKKYLTELDIPFKDGYAQSGIVATIGTGSSPMVALRADMDALPILEPEGVGYRSENDGAMHACGHDSHMTMLLGAAKMLKAREPDMGGTVKLVFQPAEEGGAGGKFMIEQGALDGVEAAFGFHVWPALPSGVVATKAGTIMAATKTFRVVVQGKGGHAAMPHQNIDPVVASASLISALQTLVSRNTSPLDSSVISVTRIHAGEAFNVIPNEVEIGGTVRMLSMDTWGMLQTRFEETLRGVMYAHSCNATLDWREEEQPFYPPTVNNEAAAAFVTRVAENLVGPERVALAETSMGGEDFSFFGQAVPSAFTFLGIGNEELGSTAPLHSPSFVLDETIMPVGAAMHTAIALRFIEAGNKVAEAKVAAAAEAEVVKDEL